VNSLALLNRFELSRTGRARHFLIASSEDRDLRTRGDPTTKKSSRENSISHETSLNADPAGTFLTFIIIIILTIRESEFNGKARSCPHILHTSLKYTHAYTYTHTCGCASALDVIIYKHNRRCRLFPCSSSTRTRYSKRYRCANWAALDILPSRFNIQCHPHWRMSRDE